MTPGFPAYPVTGLRMSLADLGNMSSVIPLLLACVSLQSKLCRHVFPFLEWALDSQPGQSQLLLPETFSGISMWFVMCLAHSHPLGFLSGVTSSVTIYEH